MILISYDIKDNKLRSRFSRYLKKYGYMLQYSVYEITNSKRMLSNIIINIKTNFENQFSQEDSIVIIETSENCKITKFGYSKNDESDIIIVD